jgi:hypothetical protein
MKGPSLQYELRALRVFRCDGCGREAQSPAFLTTHLCPCSDPPRFMRPLERPPTLIPDVTTFVTPDDPADLVEEELPDSEPHIPYIPPMPVKPVRFPGRRKLTDDIEKYQPVEFGAGIDAPVATPDRSDDSPEGFRDENGPATADARRDRRLETGGRNEPRRQRGGRRNRHTVSEEPASYGISGAPPEAPPSVLPPVANTVTPPVIPSAGAREPDVSDGDSEISDIDSSAAAGTREPRRRGRRRGRRGRGPGSAPSGESR